MISDYKYKLIQNEEELNQLIRYCKQTRYCSSDFETTGTNAMYPGSLPTILGVSFQTGGAWVIPLAHKESIFRKNFIDILQKFGREVIENPNIVKIGQNIKYEMQWWKKYGIIMRGRVFDTMLGKYLLDEERPHDLKSLVDRFIPDFTGYDLTGQPGDKATSEQLIDFWSNVPLEKLSKYCSLDADLTFRLWIFFEQRLIDNGFYPLFRNMMMMATRVLCDAEYKGMDIDTNYLQNLRIIYQERISICEHNLINNPLILKYEKSRLKQVKREMIAEYQEEIVNLKKAGGSAAMIKTRENKLSKLLIGEYSNKKDAERLAPINFGSPKQMIDLLFESEYGFQFKVISYTEDKKTKKETSTPSTAEDTLTKLLVYDDSGFIRNLLQLRELTKLYSTYIDGLWKRTNSNGRVHGSFLLHGTVTGRLSSRNPNLQNIPRDTTSSDIKKIFVAPPGKLILQLDYSQVELRVLAAAAGETTMIQWFKEGKDIHTASCALKWGVDYDYVKERFKNEEHAEHKKWKARRKQAKTINFGIVYGQTATKLAENLAMEGEKISIEEAQGFLDDFNKQFPRIKKFIARQKKFAMENGYVYNLFGRKRRLPNIYSNSWGKKSEAERQSVNAPIQGAASDFALFSSILIRDALLRDELPSGITQVGTVHDSLIFYIDPAIIHKIIPKLYAICKNPETKIWFNFEIEGIEMKVDFEIGPSWGNLSSYKQTEDYTKLVRLNRKDLTLVA